MSYVEPHLNDMRELGVMEMIPYHAYSQEDALDVLEVLACMIDRRIAPNEKIKPTTSNKYSNNYSSTLGQGRDRDCRERTKYR